MWLFLLKGLNKLLSKLNVTSKIFTIFKLEYISIFNPIDLKALIIFCCKFRCFQSHNNQL